MGEQIEEKRKYSSVEDFNAWLDRSYKYEEVVSSVPAPGTRFLINLPFNVSVGISLHDGLGIIEMKVINPRGLLR